MSSIFAYNPEKRLAKPVFNFKRIVRYKEALSKSWISRGYPLDSNPIPTLAKNYKKHSELQFDLSQMARKLNEKSRKYSQLLKKKKQESIEKDDTCCSIVQDCRDLKKNIAELSEKAHKLESEMTALAFRSVNFTSPNVGPKDKVIKEHFPKLEDANFPVLTHVQLGTKYLDILDLERAGRVIGHGFYYGKDELVLLERALTSYAIDVGLKRGWRLLSVPDLVKKSAVAAAGFLPKSTDIHDSSIVYEISANDNDDNDNDGGSELCLAGTSELSILSYLSDRHFDSNELPLKFIAER